MHYTTRTAINDFPSREPRTTDTLLGFSELDSLPPKAEPPNKTLIQTHDLYRGVTVEGLALNIHLAFSGSAQNFQKIKLKENCVSCRTILEIRRTVLQNDNVTTPQASLGLSSTSSARGLPCSQDGTPLPCRRTLFERMVYRIGRGPGLVAPEHSLAAHLEKGTRA